MIFEDGSALNHRREQNALRDKGKDPSVILARFRWWLFIACLPLGLMKGQESELERNEAMEQIFQQAITLYSSGDYDAAAKKFHQVALNTPLNHRTTAAYVMKGKALLRSGQSLEAAKTLRAFLAAHPKSTYVPDAEFTIGLTFLRARRFDDAVQSFLNAWRRIPASDSSSTLRDDIVAGLDMVLDSTYNVLQVKDLIGKTTGRVQRVYLWLKVAEMHVAGSRLRSAEAVLDTLARYSPVPIFGPRIGAVRSRVELRSDAKLGALLPLMKNDAQSSVKEIGEEILDGILFAIDEHNADRSTKVKVTLDVRDTERDPLVATRMAQELTTDPEIVAIVGPVFSTTASAVVGLANARGVPLVTPTANSNGIAAVGSFIFQANPDYETRGRAMARFAVQRRGHRTLAVLSPIDTYSKYMAEAFIKEAIALGAKVVATEWYQRGVSDFSPQMKSIRNAGLVEGFGPMLSFGGSSGKDEIAQLVRLGVPQARIDSLLSRSSLIPAKLLLGENAEHLVDSLGLRTYPDVSMVDSLEYPVRGIDGFYVPISMPEEIGEIVSQIVYFNFETELLGSGEWNSFTELNSNKRYCSNVYFDADSYVDPTNTSYAAFVDRFFERTGKRPSKHTLYGYDTAMLVLAQIGAGAQTRETIAGALGEVVNYQGLHSKIGFTSGRVNKWLQILHFDGERIGFVDEMSIE